MENEDYTTMFYKDLIKYNLKRIKHEIFMDDLSVINNHNPFDIEDIKKFYTKKFKTRDSLSKDLLLKLSTNIFMGLDGGFDKWYYFDLLISCLDAYEEIEKLEDLASVVADNIINIKSIVNERMDKYRIDNNHVALDKIFIGDKSLKILGTFIAFEEGIIYE